MNQLRTFLLMAILTVVVVFLGGVIAGEQGLIYAVVIAVAMNFFPTGSAIGWP